MSGKTESTATTNSEVIRGKNINMETERIAREINSAFVEYKLGNNMEYRRDMNCNFFNYCEKMYNACDEHLTIEVSLDSNENIKTFLKDVLTEMFSDNIINWGRIIMVFVIGAKLAVLCKDKNRTDLIDQVIQSVDKFLKTEFLEWINLKGGWKNFDQSYTEHNRITETPLINVSLGIASSLVATLFLFKTFCQG
ncbi:apoptosis regulator BAX-like [Anneissia japonica]|uniref:apoptosis regulator BAX-like n=1 Tax=Anneissia japonica TaxID=1529436 RepID=UPI0014255C81|nr:apoptosis regulator BAX-like [Anneissia japonica]